MNRLTDDSRANVTKVSEWSWTICLLYQQVSL